MENKTEKMSWDDASKKCIIKVGDIRQALDIYPDDWDLLLNCEGIPVEFNRAKTRGEKLTTIEMNNPNQDYHLELVEDIISEDYDLDD